MVTPCAQPGCPSLAINGARCEEHQARHAAQKAAGLAAYDSQRGSPQGRGYDPEWTRLRRAFLRSNPVCPCGQPATIAHHRRPLRDGGARLDPANLVPVCAACHQVEHARLRHAQHGG